jgi:hypothetical protein
MHAVAFARSNKQQQKVESKPKATTMPPLRKQKHTTADITQEADSHLSHDTRRAADLTLMARLASTCSAQVQAVCMMCQHHESQQAPNT